jgi:polyribonucleotide nucleotidyltransferase
MPSKARKAFDENIKDIEKLMELHQKEGGKSRGRRYDLEVLNKSAIVLITSFWEAYCEDIASEALEHIINNIKSSDNLPKELKKQVAKELEENKNELAIWEVADDKWKQYLRTRLSEYQEKRNRKLNTPKTKNIDQLFFSSIGISKVSSSWNWSKKMTVARATEKLDKYVTLRGSIAHRGKHLQSVKKSEVMDYLEFIKKLSSKTGGAVNSHVKKVTGKSLWKKWRMRRTR